MTESDGREYQAAKDSEFDVEGFKDYLRDILTSHLAEKATGDVLIDQDDACSFVWVDVEGQCFWRIRVESVGLGASRG